VADKRGDLAGADGESDGGVNQVCEEGDAVFEVVAHDLHHARAVLDDRDFGRQEHLRCAVEEAIHGLGGKKKS
jgi:hypothetical protein